MKEKQLDALETVADTLAIVVRLQASYFTVFAAVKKEWRAGR